MHEGSRCCFTGFKMTTAAEELNTDINRVTQPLAYDNMKTYFQCLVCLGKWNKWFSKRTSKQNKHPSLSKVGSYWHQKNNRSKRLSAVRSLKQQWSGWTNKGKRDRCEPAVSVWKTIKLSGLFPVSHTGLIRKLCFRFLFPFFQREWAHLETGHLRYARCTCHNQFLSLFSPLSGSFFPRQWTPVFVFTTSGSL